MVKKSRARDYAESLLIAVIIVVAVRSFVTEAFRIPSGSMEPTLLVGDYLLVNRLSYVMKLPFTDTVLLNLGRPERGDVIVFRYPEDRKEDFIKRVIGKEGDVIEIRNKVIYLNGQPMKDPHAHFEDNIIVPGTLSPRDNFGPVTVPGSSYFVMGDNRDRSYDSRFWSFVRQDDLIGKALIIYFSFNSRSEDLLHCVRWERIGEIIR